MMREEERMGGFEGGGVIVEGGGDERGLRGLRGLGKEEEGRRKILGGGGVEGKMKRERWEVLMSGGML